MGRLRCLALVLLVCSGMVCHTAGANTLEDAKQLIRAKRFDDAVHVLEILHDASQARESRITSSDRCIGCRAMVERK